MKRALRIVFAAALALMWVSVVSAQAATPEDAKALCQKAAIHYKKVGKEKAVSDFQDAKGEFIKGDLFVVVQGLNGVVVSHINKSLVGINLLETKDPSGKYFVKEMAELAKTKGSGWMTYHWTNPATKKVQLKKSWIQRIEGTDLCVNCGVYQ